MRAPPLRRPPSWPYFNTPLWLFLTIVVPICALMLPLAIFATRGWMRGSAVVVLACSLYAGLRGYVCRLVVDDDGVTWRGILRTIRLRWGEIKRIDCYVPGPSGAGYVYLTRRDHPPAGRWDVGPDTLQLQDRPGLLDALRAAHARAHSSNNDTSNQPGPN
jgi:hypothetical protein